MTDAIPQVAPDEPLSIPEASELQQYLINLRGSRYLPVSARVHAFRKAHPDWCIETEEVTVDLDKKMPWNDRGKPGYARMRAKVYDDNGRLMSTATKTEWCQNFEDAVEKAECVPTDTQILTLAGWKTHDQLVVGELVAAYDIESDEVRWTPLQRVVMYKDAPVWRVFNGKGFDVRATPDHTWPVSTRNSVGVFRSLVHTCALHSSHRIIVGRPAVAPPDSDVLPATPQYAAIMGWLMCDGNFGKYGRAYISQSKPHTVAIIDDLLVGVEHHKSVGEESERTFPAGHTSHCLAQHRWNLRVSVVHDLLAAFDIVSPEQLPTVVARLTPEARVAMLSAMMLADGTARNDFGKKRKPWVMDVYAALAALNGHMLCKIKYSSEGDVPVQRLKKVQFVYASNVQHEELGGMPVWCPTTEYGTWIARFASGTVTITGNTGAVGRALALLGYGTPLDPDLDEGRVCDTPRGGNNRPQDAQANRAQQRQPAPINAPRAQAAPAPPASTGQDDMLAKGFAFLMQKSKEAKFASIEEAVAHFGWDMQALRSDIDAIKAARVMIMAYIAEQQGA